MKIATIFFALWACLPIMTVEAANQTLGMSDTEYINNFIDDMARNHQAAFISTCAVRSKAGIYHAAIVFFPGRNTGVFIFSDRQHVVLNSGDVDWTPEGQWDMGDLEGGMYTIRIMSDLFYRLTRLPFSWASPEDIKHTLAAEPRNSCALLSG